MLLNFYQAGKRKPVELVPQVCSLDEINDVYDAMRTGKNIRGVIRVDSGGCHDG